MNVSVTPARGLRPARLSSCGTVRPRALPTHDTAVGYIVLAAILSQLTMSANLLQWAGIPYDSPGGLPIEKFHPGTYLALLAVVLQARRQRPAIPALIVRIAHAPHFALAAGLMVLCAIYALFATGLSGTAVYIESYGSAAFLGMAMEQLGRRELRMIAYAMLAAIVANALLCIWETAEQRVLVPVLLTNPDGYVTQLDILKEEFRGNALYTNPLAGAMITMMGVFICMACTMRPWLRALALCALLVSLITFGGRTAMLVTYAIMAGLGGIAFFLRLVQRRLDGAGLVAAVAAIVGVPGVLGVVLFLTPLGIRIAGKFYIDNSATVRWVQWSALSMMNLRDWLFGMNAARLDTVMLQIGLDPPFNDIENFWLLVFVSLGITGFAIWLAGFAVLIRRLWIAPGMFGRIILLSVLLVASGSNSLGRKSNILFLCVAAILSSAAFSRAESGQDRAFSPETS